MADAAHVATSNALSSAGTNKNLEESFVMLANSASSLRHASARPSHSSTALQPLDSKFAQIARIFEIASEATKASWQVLQESAMMHMPKT